MALTEYTIKITNQNTNPKVLTDTLDLTTISPTGITTPQTPYEEYIADMATVGDGSITFELYDKFQFFKLAASTIFTITTANGDEAAYYEGLKLDGALIEVAAGGGADPIVETVSVVIKEGGTPTTSTTATVGENKSLTATTAPSGGTVTWASSDTAVATVSDGTVAPVAAGTTVITATTTIKGVTATAACVVTVSA